MNIMSIYQYMNIMNICQYMNICEYGHVNHTEDIILPTLTMTYDE